MKAVVVATLILSIAIPARTQIREGKNNELGLSGSFQYIKSSGSSDGDAAILISPRIGFFVSGGLEIEPEVIVAMGEGMGLSYVLNANVAYNFTGGKQGVPFLLAGYGYANTVPVFGVPALSPDYGLWVLNLGAGLKVFFADEIAVRVEYRYQNYSGSGETVNYGWYSYTRNTDVDMHLLQFGFSVLL